MLIISTAECCSNTLDKDSSDRKGLTRSIGRSCLSFLKRCVHGRPNLSTEVRGYVEYEDMQITMGFPNAQDGSQSARRILELFEDLLKDLNLSFQPNGSGRWNFRVKVIKNAFQRLSIGLETNLADMREGTEANHFVSVDSITKGLRPLLIRDVNEVI